MSRSRSVSSIRFPSYSPYGRSRSSSVRAYSRRSAVPGKTKAGRFKAAVKKIVLGTTETKRRATTALHKAGTAMTITLTSDADDAGMNGLWLASAAASNTLSRPDTALVFPQNAVFGAIAKGDNSNQREGDNVLVTLYRTKYSVTIKWNGANTFSRAAQRINCLEFMLCIKDPVIALAMCVDMDTEGDDYNDNVMRILTAAGLFSFQADNAAILAVTPATNSLSAQTLWQRDSLFGVKEWKRDWTNAEQVERRAGTALGSVVWHKWRTFRRPTKRPPSVVVPIVTTTEATADITGNLSATATIAAHNYTNVAYEVHDNDVNQRVRMGVSMRFKKPVKIVYNIDTDGSETTPSLPTNKTYIYGTWWISDAGAGAVVALYDGQTEIRWKDP